MSDRPNAIPSRTSRSRRSVSWRVTAGRRPDPGHRQPEHGHQRVRVPGPTRREAGQLPVERVVDVHGGEREVEDDREPRVGRRGLSGQRPEPLAELVPAIGRDLEAGRAGVTAVPDEQVGATPPARPRGRASRRCGTTPGRRCRDRRRRRPDGRDPRRASSATRPTMPTAHGPANDRGVVRRLVGHRGTSLRDGDLHEVAPRQVGRLEGVGVQRGLGRVVGQQEPRRLEGLAHPAGGIEARGEGERDGLEIDRSGATRPARGEPRGPAGGRGGVAPGRSGRSPGSRRRAAPRPRPSRWSRGRRGPARPPGRPAGPRAAAGPP